MLCFDGPGYQQQICQVFLLLLVTFLRYFNQQQVYALKYEQKERYSLPQQLSSNQSHQYSACLMLCALYPEDDQSAIFLNFRLFNINSLRKDESDHAKMMREGRVRVCRVCVTLRACTMGGLKHLCSHLLLFFRLFLPNTHTGPADRSAPFPIRRPTNI